ncbi:MAG: thiamine-binding protein [Flavobacteriales bacterium]|nr:thiamine-binding protein [Flavobacteriales bacterium]
MQAIVDVSLYPLANDFIPHIDTFIYKIQENSNLEVTVSETSTSIKGEYDELMSVLTEAMKSSLSAVPCSFNLRILGGATGDVENKHL